MSSDVTLTSTDGEMQGGVAPPSDTDGEIPTSAVAVLLALLGGLLPMP
jgi:hypothetical protein